MSFKNFTLYRSEPHFGLDIGHSSMKVMQLHNSAGKKPKVIGYGVSDYYQDKAISNGVIVDFDVLTRAFDALLKTRVVGSINAKRVACTIPTSHTFSRPMKLPVMDKRDISEAIKLEAEQYIPVPLNNLYVDFDVIHETAESIEILMMATPRTVIDGLTKFIQSAGYEPIAMEPTMNASARLFKMASVEASSPTILIDFGSVATDIAVFDKGIFVNSTVSGGSDTLTMLLSKHLGLGMSEANIYKTQYGIGPSDYQQQIFGTAKPMLDALIREVRKIIRYYSERSQGTHHKISQIVTLGGGSTMRGFNEYLTAQLGLPSKSLNPWDKIDFGNLAPPAELAKSMYLTVAGEAILATEEIFE